MTAFNNKDGFIEALHNRFGATLNIRLIGKVSQKSNVEYECILCKGWFKTTAKQLLSKSNPCCVQCTASIHKQKTLGPNHEKKVTYFQRLHNKFDYIKCTRFVNFQKDSSFLCDCGHKWKGSPSKILTSKYGCSECERVKRHTDIQYRTTKMIDLITEHKPNIDVSIPMSLLNEHVDVECKICSHKWKPSIQSLTSSNTSCPNCARFNDTKHIFKTIRLDNKDVTIKGHEQLSINYLISKGVKESNIIESLSGLLPTIDYVYQNRYREYRPDIKVGNTLIKVVTNEDFFCHYSKNKSIAKACINKGHRFKVHIIHHNKVYALPDRWVDITQSDCTLLFLSLLQKTIRIASFDPGVANFAWSVLEVTRPFKVTLIATGMVKNTIRNLKDGVEFSNQSESLSTEIANILIEHDAEYLVLERFTHRPGIGSLATELINLMISNVIMTWNSSIRSQKDNIKLLLASQWKNEWNRHSNLKDFYTKVNCTVHQIDSIGIGLYGAYQWLGKKPFYNITLIQQKLVPQINNNNYENSIKTVNKQRRRLPNAM